MHTLLLVRIRKPLTKVELGELESPGGTRGHLLFSLEADLTSQPLGSTCLWEAGREHTKWKRRAQEHSQECLSQSSSTFNPISPPKRSAIHSTMSVPGIHFVLHPLTGKGLAMVAAGSWGLRHSPKHCPSLRQSPSGLSDNQETSCPSQGRKSGEYQKSPACNFIRPLFHSLPLLICLTWDQWGEQFGNQVPSRKSLWGCSQNCRNIWMLYQLGLSESYHTCKTNKSPLICNVSQIMLSPVI